MSTLVRGETTTEIGYALHADFCGHGYATETATALRDLAFAELHATEVQAQVGSRNHASRAVLGRIGIVEVAHFTPRETNDLPYAISRDAGQQLKERGDRPASPSSF